MLTLPPLVFFFFNDTATTEIYTLSLHDALPICEQQRRGDQHGQRAERGGQRGVGQRGEEQPEGGDAEHGDRSEEHTSELQSRQYLVCRLLLEKKKNDKKTKANMYEHDLIDTQTA